MVDYGGHMAAVFFISGCNLRCGFCHNAALLAEGKRGLDWDRLRRACRRFRAQWVDAAVVTGGEPTLHPGLEELLRYFRDIGWSVKLDTNGSRPHVLRECLPLVDYVAMDLKAAPSRYGELTGCEDTGAISRSVDLIRSQARDYEFRTTIVESFHDNRQMTELGDLVRGARRYVLQPFVPRDDLLHPGFREEQRTSPDRMRELADLMRHYAGEVQVRGD
jgi:pyruvate formate lyase activating enzyme